MNTFDQRANRAIVAASTTTKPRHADVARWVQAVQLSVPIWTPGRLAANRRRRAENARANLAKHNLGTNGLPLGRIA